jgi:predicted dehydrogenase
MELSIQAMEAGCHVLIEKPLAASVKEADKMIAVSERQHVKLCVVHQNLFNPVVMEAHRIVQAGELGKILDLEASTCENRDSSLCTNGNHWCHKLPGGIFFEILPHPAYLTRLFLGDAQVATVLPAKLGEHKWMPFDEVRVDLKSNNGIASIAGSCNSHIHGDYFNILGVEGAVEADLWGRTILLRKPRSTSALGVGIGNLKMSAQLLKILGSTVSTTLKAIRGKASAHYGFIEAFVKSVVDDTAPPTTGEDGRANVVILEEIARKLDRGN